MLVIALFRKIALDHVAERLAREVRLIAELAPVPVRVAGVRGLRASGRKQRQAQQQAQQQRPGAAYAVFHRVSHSV